MIDDGFEILNPVKTKHSFKYDEFSFLFFKIKL